MNFAREEEETLYPSIPKGEFDKTLWNKLVVSTFGPEKSTRTPFVRKQISKNPPTVRGIFYAFDMLIVTLSLKGKS